MARARVDAGTRSREPGIGGVGIAQRVEVEAAHVATSSDRRSAASPRNACVLTVPTEQPQRLGHLGFGQVDEVPQHHDLALLRRQCEQRALEVDPLRVDAGNVADRGQPRACCFRTRSIARFPATRTTHGSAYAETFFQRTKARANVSWAMSSDSPRSPSTT